MNNPMYPEIRMNDQKAINTFLRVSPYAQSTKQSYGWVLVRFARYCAKERLSFEDLDSDDVIGFLEEQSTWGDSIKGLAVRALRSFLKYKYGEEHQALSLRIRKPSIKPQRTLNMREVIQLINYLEKEVLSANTDNRFNRAIRNLSMVCLLLDVGLRSIELCNLKVADVELEDHRLQVMVKGGSWEYGMYSEYTAANLEDWLTVRTAHVEPGVPYVFVGILGATPGEQMTTSGLRAIFRKMAKRSGVPHFSTHAFRRTGATIATMSGGPGRIVRMAWRWKTEQQLDRYTQALPLGAIEPYLPLNQIDTESLRGYNRAETKRGKIENQQKQNTNPYIFHW